MERKEAIEIFEDELYFSMKPACQKVGEKFTIPTKVYREALCMAIGSLKADDSSLEDIPTITIPVEDYLKLLEGKQEPKTGHWKKVIDIQTDNITEWHYECSNCGCKRSGVCEDLNNYCPNCGCRMVEPQESEET